MLWSDYAATDTNCSGNAINSGWVDRELMYDKMTAGSCFYAHPAVHSAASDEQNQ